MANDINISEAYYPLFKANTRYTIVTGGRGSGKSFALACATLMSTYDDPYNILYTRYTLVSADVSIIPEYTEKIEMLECEGDFTIKRREVVNERTGATILFRGLRASSKNQIAKLKSLNRIKTWILDEAQELMDESLFDTIDLSIREKDAENRVILVLNPDSINHWIYRRFFAEAGVEYDFNGVKGNVTYIHTTYKDNEDNLDDGFLDIAESLREKNFDKWEHIFGGKWMLNKAGLIYTRWEEIPPDQYPHHLEQWYGNDWGYGGDANALIRMCFDALTQTIYLWEVCCTQLLTTDVARYLKEDAKRIGYEPSHCLVYCDPARPDNIALLRRMDVSAVPAVNRDKVGRISYLQGFKVKYVGENIRKEVQAYSWQPHPQDTERFTDKPQDGNDHCFTGSTIITTQQGGKAMRDVVAGDMVLTSQGWRKVVKKWDNGVQDVLCMSLKFSNFSVYIEATPTHKFKTDKGWKQLQSLQEGDRLFLQYDSTGAYTRNMKGQSIIPATDGNCTGMCGNRTTGKSQEATKYTTRISTPIITRLRTLFASRSRNTSASIPNTTGRMVSQNGQSKGFTILDHLQPSGIAAQKVESGTGSTQQDKCSKMLNAPALCVERHSTRRRKMRTTALISAEQKHAGIVALTTKQESARCVAEPLKQTDMASSSIAVCLVVQSIENHCAKRERVYDLTIEDCHEYFANGILVHNCMDAISYGAVTHLRRMGITNEWEEK